MVKTPHTRHSKSSKEPVTIDLAPGEVSRLKAEAEAQKPAAGADEATTATATASDKPASKETASRPGPDSAATASSTATSAAAGAASSGKPESPKEDEKPAKATGPETVKPAAAEGAKSTQSSASSASFGRNEKPASPVQPPVQKRGSVLPGAIAGGLVALVVAGGLSYSGLLPSGSVAPVQEDASGAAIATLESELATLRQQVEAIGAGGDDAALAGRIEAVEQQAATFASDLETLRSEVAQAGSQTGTGETVDLTPIDDRIAALENSLEEMRNGAAQQPALDEQLVALREEIVTVREATTTATGRLDALEQTVTELTTRVDEAAETPSTAIIIAASSLKAAIDRGAPFTTELETYAALKPDASELNELRDMAASGVPTRAQIAAESDAAANAMIAATRPVDPDAGILDRLTASAMGLVQVRPVGMVEGDGVPEIAARIDAAIQAGDYERALNEYETLPAEAKAASESFVAKVRARHAADRLVDQALAAALRS